MHYSNKVLALILSNKVRCTGKAHHGDQDAVDSLNAHTAVEALIHTVMFASTLVLCHESGHGVADVLLRGIGKVIDAGSSGKGCHGVDTHGVHDGLTISAIMSN